MPHKRRAIATVLIAACAAPAVVLGQGTTASDQTLPEVKVRAAPPAETPYGPDDGFKASRSVTTTKTDTPLAETPQSISVITRERLEAQNVGTLGEALRYTAGIQGEPFGFEPRLTFLRIRGFDATETGLYRDGLQLRNASFAVAYMLEPYGLERIEVLKGPSSILYGAGSPGGLINLVSKRPTADPYRIVEFEAGNYNLLQGKLDLAGPVDKDGAMSYRLTGLLRDSDTQVDYIQNNRRYVAPAFTYRPSQDTSLTVLTYYQEDETKSSQALPAYGTLWGNPNGKVPTSRFTGEPDIDFYDHREYAIGYLFEHRATDAVTLRQNARYLHNELDHITIYSSSFGADLRTLGRSIYGSEGKVDGFTIDNQAQVKLTTGSVRHTLLAGLDYQHLKVGLRQTFGAAPSLDVFNPVYGAAVATPAVFLDNDISQNQLGLYVQDQLALDRWLLLLGGRYDTADTETANKLTNVTTKQDDDAFTYRAGLMYRFDAGFAPYFSYATSFLPALGTSVSGAPFEPETGEQYEVGVKFEPRGGKSLFTLALFDLTREGFLQTDPVTFRQVQTGEARSRGLEFEGVGRLTDALSLVATYTYLDAEVTQSVTPGQQGKRPVQTPAHMASLWADYAFRGQSLSGWSAGAGARYQSGSYGDVANTIESPDTLVADAALRYEWQAFRFALNVKNVFDKEYVASCFTRGGSAFCTIGDRRTVIANVGYRF
jgi:iron complex outermembrane receptor protein